MGGKDGKEDIKLGRRKSILGKGNSRYVNEALSQEQSGIFYKQ